MIAVTSHKNRALRRLVAGLALCALAAIGTAAAQARAPVRPAGGISVDVKPLLDLGLGSFAEILRADLAQALAAEFTGHLAPGQRVVAQIRGLSLTSYADDFDYFGNNDYLDGVATLIGADGREIATQKILTVLPASYGAPWYVPGSEQRRTAGLAKAFASWARRYLVG
jgi:hypothetical protein